LRTRRRTLAPRPSWWLAWAAPLALALASCAGEPEGPEARIRAVLQELERAAEEGELRPFRQHVSEHYEDPRGFDKEALLNFARLQVLRAERRHVIVRVRGVDLRDPRRAEVELVVGLAGSRLTTPEDAARLRADVYKVDVDLEEEEDGVWRIVWAQWRQTVLADLL
jgi:hypothetical protein